MSSKKKDLSAFLQKNKKKNKAAQQPVAAAESDPVQNTSDQKKQVEAEVITKKEVKKAESSDEEVDDVDLDQDMNFGKIVDEKDIVNKEQKEEKAKKGFGFDAEDTEEKKETKATGEVKRKDASNIQFGGRPTKFTRRGKLPGGGKFGDEFSEGLDDIDDNGEIKKKKKEYTPQESGAGGQREFVNLGSKARGPRDEEKPEESKKTGVKPTFRGKLKIGGNDDADDNKGVVTNYGFQVSYKKDHEPKKEGTADESKGQNEARKERKPKEKGMSLGAALAQEQADLDDDGFEVVKQKERKPKFRKQEDSSDEDSGFTIKRGGGGGRGRGGFFKNSKRDN